MGSIGNSISSSNTPLFNEGDTPKVLDNNAVYNVIKQSGSKTIDYGNNSGEDTKRMLRGYKFNGLFWENPNTMTVFTIERKK